MAKGAERLGWGFLWGIGDWLGSRVRDTRFVRRRGREKGGGGGEERERRSGKARQGKADLLLASWRVLGWHVVSCHVMSRTRRGDEGDTE